MRPPPESWPAGCWPGCAPDRRRGEAGPVHSAAVKVVDDYPWPVVDLRIDWAEVDPLAALEQLWLAWEPQMDAYITRALDPRGAAYGVPGDE